MDTAQLTAVRQWVAEVYEIKGDIVTIAGVTCAPMLAHLAPRTRYDLVRWVLGDMTRTGELRKFGKSWEVC